jgi:hypothetical protein
VLRAVGISDGVASAAVAALPVKQAEPALSLTLGGGDRMTDQSPAEITAVLTNAADTPLAVALKASAGRNQVALGPPAAGRPAAGPLCVLVPARAGVPVHVQVTAGDPVRRGTTLVFVSATSTATGSARAPCPQPVDELVSTVTATRPVQVDLAASDLLPGALGITSVLALPGLVAVWAWLAVRRWDITRTGLVVASPGETIWQNKLWLLLAAAISLVVAYAAALLTPIDLLDAYGWSDIAVVTVVAGAAAAGLSALEVKFHRHRVPLLTPRSDEHAVARAALGDGKLVVEGGAVTRRVYRTGDGKAGLVVLGDRGALILTPQILFSAPAKIVLELAKKDVTAALIRELINDDFDGKFSTDDKWVGGPCAVASDALTPAGVGALLVFRDTD